MLKLTPNIYWRTIVPSHVWFKYGYGDFGKYASTLPPSLMRTKLPIRMKLRVMTERGFFDSSRSAVRAQRALRAIGLIPNYGEFGL